VLGFFCPVNLWFHGALTAPAEVRRRLAAGDEVPAGEATIPPADGEVLQGSPAATVAPALAEGVGGGAWCLKTGFVVVCIHLKKSARDTKPRPAVSTPPHSDWKSASVGLFPKKKR